MFASPVNCFLHVEIQSQTFMQNSLGFNPGKNGFEFEDHRRKYHPLAKQGAGGFPQGVPLTFQQKCHQLKIFCVN